MNECGNKPRGAESMGMVGLWCMGVADDAASLLIMIVPNKKGIRMGALLML